MANLREITAKVNEGEGTVGALIADPTVYERLVTILDGASRSRLLRGLLRGLGGGDKTGEREGE
jgi:phospholipid/cholesterol/gamma-HCH transport system substrate-binding protein